MARTKLYPPSVDPGFPELPPTPRGWTRMTFGDVVEPVERPVALEPSETYRLLTAKRSRGGIVLRGELLGREILTKTQFEAKAGDFLISRRQIIHGACGLVPEELDGAVVSNEYSTLKPRKQLLRDFLAHYSHTSYFQRTCFHSSHGVDVEKMIFKIDEWLRREVNVPPVSEQRQIAAVLSCVDDAIVATQAVIDQLQVVKKAMMAELLTRGVAGRHTRFKRTELGDVPEDWHVCSIGDLVEFSGGSQPPKENFISEPREGYVRLVQIRDYKTDRFQTYVPRNMVRKFCDTADVMIGRYGPPVFQILRGIEGAYNVALMKAMPRDTRLSQDYLFYVLQQGALFELIERLSQRTSGQTGVDVDALRAYPLALPTADEQAAIVAAINACEMRIGCELAHYEGLRSAKAALSSALLTGELRVTPDKDPTP